MKVNHKDRDHALLSASGANRWLNCTPSARLEEQFPETETDYTIEGTLAHEIADLYLKKQTGEITEELFNAELSIKMKHEKFDKEMLDNAKYYVSYIEEIIDEREGSSLVMTEQKLDFSNYVEEGFGTGDCTIITEDIMDIIDLKYGKGVPVSAEDNNQMKLYALGALNMFGNLYSIKKIVMHIFQPRIDNFSQFEITVEELVEWAENDLKPKAELAYAGEGDYVPGGHCKFCRARHVCEARAKEGFEIVKRDFEPLTTLTVDQIEKILPKIDKAIAWLEDIKEYAFNEAIKGKKWPGFKLVEGKSNRAYSDQDKVLETLKKAKYPEAIITERKLLGITAMEKVLGKKEFEKVLGELVIKPQGKPTLVSDTDKRPEINVTNDFEAIEEKESD